MKTRAARLTLQDIANLALVDRSVVSKWRTRPAPATVPAPFPDALMNESGLETFDLDEVVNYLTQTGRGNNDQLRVDALAAAPPVGADLDVLQALLCLHALTGEELAALDGGKLAALALVEDPHDRRLLAEVRRADPALVGYVDDLVAASLGPGDAWRRVEAGRLCRERGERGFHPGLHELVAAVTAACREHVADLDPAVAPPAGLDLVTLAEGFSGIARSDDPSAPEARRLRRLTAIHELREVLAPRATVRVATILAPDTSAALSELDQLVLDLGPADMAVVLGPASLLCDALRGQDQSDRAETLRPGNLVMAIRLPRGLWKHAHRQNLALWVLRGGARYERVRIADLTEEVRIPDELTADVAAALDRSEQERAYRYARSSDLPSILAGGSVVPRGVRAVHWGRGAEEGHLDRVLAASLITSEALAGFDLAVEAAPGNVARRRRSIAELRDAGQLRVLRGSRIDKPHAVTGGTVSVLTPSGSYDDVRLDPFDVERYYPRARRTEPGDVVFEHQPPRAVVDPVGGSLVASPARIIRLAERAPIGPYLLASAINAMTHSEWETWAVAEIDRSQRDLIERAVRDAARHRAELTQRLEAVDRLTTSLVEGVAAGSVALTPSTETSNAPSLPVERRTA
ncbi:hypothetical protein [Nocardioides kribbensis]|uniref:hypothetical protein n=1 Tax=Nocardioides kribbensis TaxID=305517 RepID=UPI00187984FD|nr:hypothetical protein [Nocardioides kribbensis]